MKKQVIGIKNTQKSEISGITKCGSKNPSGIFSIFHLGKKTILVMLLMILPLAAALESTKVYIVDLSYKDGRLSINDNLIKHGYAPDRILQPLEGYKAEIVSLGNDVLYSFKFEIPLDEYVDVSNNITNQLSGGLIRLNENDFALIMPYYGDAKEIVFYDEENNEVVSVDVKEKEAEEERNYLAWFLGFIILLVLVVWLVRYKKKKGE